MKLKLVRNVLFITAAICEVISAQSMLGFEFPTGIPIIPSAGPSLSLARTGVGIQNDFLAMSKNPANLGIVQRAVFSSVLAYDLSSIHDNGKTSSQQLFNPQLLGFAFPLGRYGAIGLSVDQRSITDLKFHVKKDTVIGDQTLNAELGTIRKGGIVSWQAGYGYSIKKYARLGLTYERIYFTDRISDSKQISGALTSKLTDSTEFVFRGNGIRGGVMIPYKKFTGGISGEYIFLDQATQSKIVRNGDTTSSSTKFDFQPAPSLSFGASYAFSPEWLAAADLDVTLWEDFYSQFGTPRKLDNAISFSAGGQFIPAPNLLAPKYYEIMRITLEDVNQRMGSLFAVIGTDLLGFSEIYAMPHTGVVESEKLRLLLIGKFNTIFPQLKKDRFEKDLIPLVIYKGKQGECFESEELHPVVIPLMVTDRSIGTLTFFYRSKEDFDVEQNQFLYVFTSIVSSIIEHGYSVMQARQQAKTDSLTGIANHRLFHETLEREIARSNRKGCTFSLILIDIDNFKKINDTYGHQVGDAVIVDLTKRIGNIIRAGDILARYGGEEFGVILPETDLHGSEILASRILNAFTARPLTYLHHKLSYSASIGVSIYNGMVPVKKDVLIRSADQALYDSKRNGKNRFTVGTIVL